MAAGRLWLVEICTLAIGLGDLLSDATPERRTASTPVDDDETSLLQVGVNTPVRNVPLVGQEDIPEGPHAWALFQPVGDGQTDTQLLQNTTVFEPPGIRNPGVQVGPHGHGQGHRTYWSPTRDEKTPPFVYYCLGEDWDPTPMSSWKVEKVTSPQLVPFIVPMDQPNRTDVSIVLAPGGGSEFLAWQAEGTDIARLLNVFGISAFVLKYRVPAPSMWEQGAAVMDAQRAISMVKHFAPAMGLNRSRVGLFGASHGGFVASIAGFAVGRGYARRDTVDDQDFRPDFLLLNYPEIRMPELLERLLDPSLVTSYYNIPIGRFNNLPPIFIASGVQDKCITPDIIFNFGEMLTTQGQPTVEVNIFNGIGHGFSSCIRKKDGSLTEMEKEACMWMFRARRFIMWEVEKRTPDDVEKWYNMVRHLVAPSLLSTRSFSKEV